MTGGVEVMSPDIKTHALVEDVEGAGPVEGTHRKPWPQGPQQRVEGPAGTVVRYTACE